MSYTLAAWVALQSTFDGLEIRSVPLAQGFALTTDNLQENLTDKTLAYLEADFFGGSGDQYSKAYVAGVAGFVAFGPTYNAINNALKLIGVVRTEGHDEFDTLGLGKHRDNDWLPRESTSSSFDDIEDEISMTKSTKPTKTSAPSGKVLVDKTELDKRLAGCEALGLKVTEGFED